MPGTLLQRKERFQGSITEPESGKCGEEEIDRR
jgi:hypothetical protein